MNRRIACRFCRWSTPVWLGRQSGWVKLTGHIIDKHPGVRVKPVLAAFGTTANGMAVVRKMDKP